jgi:hypothetical protein
VTGAGYAKHASADEVPDAAKAETTNEAETLLNMVFADLKKRDRAC